MYDYQVDQEAILRLLGQGNTSPEYKRYLMGYILPLFDQRLTLRFENELSGEDLAAFTIAENDPAKTKAFVQQHFPNRSQIYSDELSKFITDLQPRSPEAEAEPDENFQLPFGAGPTTTDDDEDDQDDENDETMPQQTFVEPAPELQQTQSLQNNDEGTLNLRQPQPTPDDLAPLPPADTPQDSSHLNG